MDVEDLDRVTTATNYGCVLCLNWLCSARSTALLRRYDPDVHPTTFRPGASDPRGPTGHWACTSWRPSSPSDSGGIREPPPPDGPRGLDQGEERRTRRERGGEGEGKRQRRGCITVRPSVSAPRGGRQQQQQQQQYRMKNCRMALRLSRLQRRSMAARNPCPGAGSAAAAAAGKAEKSREAAEKKWRKSQGRMEKQLLTSGMATVRAQVCIRLHVEWSRKDTLDECVVWGDAAGISPTSPSLGWLGRRQSGLFPLPVLSFRHACRQY